MSPSELATLIQEILDTDRMAVDDNFFDLGGNSILALTLISRVEERCGVALPLIDVIRNPTPAGIAVLIAKSAADPAASGASGPGGAPR